jgi:hypothetical protein
MTILCIAVLDTGTAAHPRPYLESLHDMIVHDELVHGCLETRPYLESLRDKVVHDELVHGKPGHWHLESLHKKIVHGCSEQWHHDRS